MAEFPALKPTARSYSLGEFTVVNEDGYGGGRVRFLHGTEVHSIALNLQFTALTQEDADLIRTHYRTQQGGFVSFQLPDEIWIGHSSSSLIISGGTYWRYTQPISETHLPIGRISVDVQLASLI